MPEVADCCRNSVESRPHVAACQSRFLGSTLECLCGDFCSCEAITVNGTRRNMSVASWDLGTDAKIYQCILDTSSYRWQHHPTESAKINLSTLSTYVHSSLESSEAKSSGAQPASRITGPIRHGEYGPVSSVVLHPCIGGEDAEGSLFAPNWKSQRRLRSGCPFTPSKVYPHGHDYDTYEKTIGLTTQSLILSTAAPSLSQDCVGPASSVGAGDHSLASSRNGLQDAGDDEEIQFSFRSSLNIGAGEHSLAPSDKGSLDDDHNEEIQATLRSSLNMSTLEDSLPIRRGLSRYFSGQSKSFSCLADALTMSLSKPVNPSAKRRKSLCIYDDRQRTFPRVSRASASRISKKGTFGSTGNIALAVAMGIAQEEDEGALDDISSHLSRK